jgi:hypothetical protein
MILIRHFFAFQVLFASLALAAPPANDGFSSATVIGPALPVTLFGNAREATYQAGEPVLDSESRNGSIWFKWVPSSAGTGFAVPVFTWEAVGPTIPGTGFEMLVHAGTDLAGLTTIARGEEAAPVQRFAFTTGQTYYIQVFVTTDTVSATFPWKLEMSSTTAAPAAPINDAFASATTIATSLPRTATGTTVAATIESGESIDNYLTRSVWYKYTTSTTAVSRLFTLTPDGADSFPKAEVFTGSSLTTLSRVGWIDSYGETLIPLAASTTYHIRVFNEDAFGYSIPGTFSLRISASPVGAVPDNNNFANATNLGSALDVVSAADSFKSSVEAGEKLPMGTTGTVWFKWTAPTAGWFAVSAISDDFPPGLSVWAGSSLANLKLKASSDSYNALTTFKADLGEVVYFQACGEGGYFFPFELTVSPAVDPDAPRLTSSALSTSTIDVTSAARTVTLTLNIEGPADGYIDYVDILHPNGGVADFAITSDFVQVSGTPGNGAFTASLTIPAGAAPGSYPLVVNLRDGTETADYTFGSTGLITDRSPLYGFWPTYADIPNGPDALTVTNSGTADALPALTSFTVTPTSANVGTAAAIFTFTAVVTDAQGVASVSVDWNDPAGILLGDNVVLTLTAGTALNGTWTGTLPVPRYADPGRIDLTLLVSDTIGQTRQFGIQPVNFGLRDRYNGRLQEMSNSFITLNNTVGTDVLPPQISEVTITPNPATFGSGGTVDLAVSVRAKDSLSGTDEVYFGLGSNPVVLLPRISGTAADGVYGGTVTINRADSGPGVRVSSFATYDLRGNQGIITSAVPGVPATTLLAPAVGTYDAWAFGYSLAPPLDIPSATAQADGISNALKFAFNLDPTQSITGAARTLTPGTGREGLPSITLIGSGPTNRLRIEYIRRIAAPGLSYSAEFGSTLGVWTPVTGGTVSAIDTQWERVVVEDTAGAGSPIRFGWVKVVVSP